jgi:hypothetical protein
MNSATSWPRSQHSQLRPASKRADHDEPQPHAALARGSLEFSPRADEIAILEEQL